MAPDLAAGIATRPEGRPDELVAEGFCLDVELAAEIEQKEVRWTERRWLVRSLAYAQAQQEALQRPHLRQPRRPCMNWSRASRARSRCSTPN